MDKKIFETEIECAVTILGKDIAKLEIYSTKLVLSKLKTQMDIPGEIKIEDIRTINFKITKYFDFKIAIAYQSGAEVKNFSFVTCSNVRESACDWEGVSNPLKTFKVYRLIRKLQKG